jgi:hypothetical protein
MKMTFQEIRIIAIGPCIANQLRDVNTICRRSWYIAAHVWKIYDFKLLVLWINVILLTFTVYKSQKLIVHYIPTYFILNKCAIIVTNKLILTLYKEMISNKLLTSCLPFENLVYPLFAFKFCQVVSNVLRGKKSIDENNAKNFFSHILGLWF